MSDRSFGDHAFRNVVKNPLLSTSVTGLSIEDLTHNAMLLPAVPSQEISTRRDDRSVSQPRTLTHSEHEFANLPSGDTNFNINPSNTLTNVDLNPTNSQNVMTIRSNELSTSNLSKASVKSDDDFDVNEYIARLQGTRYVSAPLNSVLKDDQNANLESSEENLEEINLNEDKVQSQENVQQSITADIAQNFSQLPTVLPQMASVVFNSFSNMLSMKSREQTPDDGRKPYDSSYRPPEPSTPVMAVPDIVKDIAPPPPLKEPPTVGAANYRITTKKKVYAQIPGLSTGETVQNIPTYNQPPAIQHQYFTPDAIITQEPSRPNIATHKQYPESRTSFELTDFDSAMETRNITEVRSTAYDIFTPTKTTAIDAVKQTNVSEDLVINSTKSTFDIKPEQVNILQSQPNQSFSPSSQNVIQEAFAPSVNTIQLPGTAVIPPPPMFTNLPKRDYQASVGKSVLPPSVARRISANQPIIKSQSPTMLPYNIFIPQNQSISSTHLPSKVINSDSSSVLQSDERLTGTNVQEVSTEVCASKSHLASSEGTISISGISQAAQSNVVNTASPSISSSVNLSPNVQAEFMLHSTLMPCLQQSSNSATICPPPIKASMLPPSVAISKPTQDIGNRSSLTFDVPPRTISTVPDVSSEQRTKSKVYDLNPDQVDISTTPVFFNPSTVPIQLEEKRTTKQNTSQYFNPNDVQTTPSVSVPQPPKAFGVTNYRMTKKKPHYYSGPIEGVGNISNNIKPVLHPAQSTSFEGSLFTPQEPTQLTQSSESYHTETAVETVSFDNFTIQPVSSLNDSFNSSSITSPHQEPKQGYYNTVFDLSRATTDSFEPPQQEAVSFGIIGSLKSKLSSIDIGKIQNTVTTFFDPSYNDVKPNSLITQDIWSYEPYYKNTQSSSTQHLQDQAACLDMLVVPNSEPINEQNSHGAKYETTNQNERVICEQNRHVHEHSINNSAADKPHELNPPIAENFETNSSSIPYFNPNGLNVLTFAERSALIETVANALDPNWQSVPEPVNANKTESSPGFILSFAPIDETLDTVKDTTNYPKIVTSEPLNEEQQRKLYEEIMNRPPDMYDSDINVIEPPDYISPQNVRKSDSNPVLSTSSNVDYDSSNHYVEQYFSNIGATPFYDKLVNYQTPLENMTSESSKTQKPYENDPHSENMNSYKEKKLRTWIDDVGTYLILPNQEENNFVGTELEEEKEINKVTKKMIENITAPIQLSNPVEVPLTESNPIANDISDLSCNQNAHFTEETIETIQVQSAKELLQHTNVDNTILKSCGWQTGNDIVPTSVLRDHSYVDPNAIGFLQNTSNFFDNILTNASDELKAECQVSLDDHVVLPRQMSIPTAPPVEEDSKSDEGVLDVQSIEQDAKNFMFSHDFIIEPETDDGKIKELERTSDEHAAEIDSFTNRVEKYKKLEETASDEIDEGTEKHVNKPYASYFDTGDFAADNHYKNSSYPNFIPYGPHNIPVRIPPGFEQEYYRKYNLTKRNQPHDITNDNKNNAIVSEGTAIEIDKNENVREIPDTTTQTSVSQTVTITQPNLQDVDKFETASDKIEELVQQFINREPKQKVQKMHDSNTMENEETLANMYGLSDEQLTELFGNLDITIDSPVKVKRTHQETIEAIMRHLHYSPVGETSNRNGEQSTINKPIVSTPSNIQGGTSFHIHEGSSDLVDSNYGEKTNQESLNVQHLVRDTQENKNKHPLKSSTSETSPESGSAQYYGPSTSQAVWTIPDAVNAMPDDNIEHSKNRSLISISANVISLSDSINTNSTAAHFYPQIIESGDSFEKNTKHISSLPDPASFFSTEPTTAPEISNNMNDDEEEKSFSRLSSYFATPTTKNDHSKSFFDLSQSQDHYRHNQNTQSTLSFNRIATSNVSVQAANINTTVTTTVQNIPLGNYFANMNLVRELASTKNYTPQNIVTTTNYFTVHYDFDNGNNLNVGEPNCVNITDKCTPLIDNKIPESPKESIKLGELGETDIKYDIDIINNCKYCCDMTTVRVTKLDVKNVDVNDKVKHVMDNNTDTNKSGDNKMEPSKEIKKKSGLTVNFETSSHQEEPNEAVSMISENRGTSEYSPVKYHWFYRVDVEGKSVWRGFSMTDSGALETAFHSPDLNENTLVATDGGRFDVNVMGRLRIAVYWSDKPTNVRRCSWFYKGTTDARYVPYKEPVAEKLEEEYRHGITTGEWHRRLILPDNEMVVMHGPAVMVHFLQTNNDAFNSSPLFSFGKRVYRSVPKIRMSQEQRAKIDHLVLLVHGVGEFRHHREKVQSMMRPRVVRRGCVESEIEDSEPSSIDHLLLLCHGVGSACDMRFRAVEEVVDDFRATSLQLLQSHYRNSCDNGLVGRIEVLPISWHSSLHSCETGVDRRLAAVTLESIPRLRSFTNDTILDVLFYTSPVYCQHIIDTVCRELNRVYQLFLERNPEFGGGVSLGGHSLGSVILYDLLCNQLQEQGAAPRSPQKQFVAGAGRAGLPAVRYPALHFRPDALYALGSPIAIFECIRGVETLGREFCLPNCRNFFNIFHPYDPIAYRIEPMINPDLRDVKPQLIPHHKGRKRMHLELKDTMARVGADIKQKIIESIRSTWSSMWKSEAPPDQHLEKVVEEEMEKEESDEERKEETTEAAVATPDMLGKLNAGRRIDYVLQEAPFEMINEYLFAMRSHVCYWESEDTMLLILREIYDCLGVQPDCSVPQQNLSVQRTRIITPDETIVLAADSPSTSRGSS